MLAAWVRDRGVTQGRPVLPSKRKLEWALLSVLPSADVSVARNGCSIIWRWGGSIIDYRDLTYSCIKTRAGCTVQLVPPFREHVPTTATILPEADSPD